MNFYCLGAAHIDIKASPLFPIITGETIPVNTISCYGGVARNVAENLAFMGGKVSLLSVVGRGAEGKNLIEALTNIGIDTNDIYVSDKLPTGKYYALLYPEGDLFIATADMNIYRELTPAAVIPLVIKRSHIQHWILDANLPPETIGAIAKAATKKQKLWGISVSAAKAPKLNSGFPHWHGLFINRNELKAITEENDQHDGIRTLIKKGCRQVFVTQGAEGVLYGEGDKIIHQPCPKADVVDVTGAGDAFCAGVIYSLAHDKSIHESLDHGFLMAKNALATKSSSLLETIST